MKQVPLNRAYRGKLKDLYETLKDRTFTHTQLKSYLGVDWGIWTARAYCSQCGIMFDWSDKRWKRNRVYERIEKTKEQCKQQN